MDLITAVKHRFPTSSTNNELIARSVTGSGPSAAIARTCSCWQPVRRPETKLVEPPYVTVAVILVR